VSGKCELTEDGWTVDDPKAFRMLLDHNPPRPFGYRYQLRVDARAWKPVALWVASALLMGLGVWNWQGLLIGAGAVVLAGWFRMYLRVVHFLRCGVVLKGVLKSVRRLPALYGCSDACVELMDGGEVTALVPNCLVVVVPRK
jgi:hypothetical protein